MILEYIRLLRISHWVKNLFVFVPLLFSQHLFQIDYFLQVLSAFFAFSFASSMVYVFNDILDAKFDKLHPIKKERPIASGKVSNKQATFIILLLAVITLLFALNMNLWFNLMLAAYVIINFFYSIKLKDVVILDLFSIASGFIFRVLAGAFVISVSVSDWLILTTMFLALFLAIMKRRSELVASHTLENSTRTVLNNYSHQFIDQISAIAAGGVIICYALYSVSDRIYKQFETEYFVLTTLLVVFGVFRYMFLVHVKSKGENPTEIMLTDIPMIINLMLYIFVVILLIYFQ
ncbi:MAG: decaprenyl-phosphate phosphoribosyltransferase [Melioribacteraceae bacterium]|nr:decaprenyl-phosphate phosphoribosyltransferase [Melioribacteraceae bacterium]